MTRFTTALVTALLAAPLCAQGPVMPYLPKDTILAIEVPDLDASLADFSSMPAAKIWREEEVQQFVQDAMNMAKGHFDQMMAQAREMHAAGAFPVDPEKLLSLRLKGGTFALTRLDMVMGKYSPEPNIGMILHLDFGTTAKEWFGLVQMGLGMLEQQAGANMVKTEAKVGTATLITMAPNRASASPMALCVAMTGNSLIVGTLEEEVRGLLENMEKGTAALAATDAYKASAQNLSMKGSELSIFMRINPMLDFGMKGLAMAAEMEPGFLVDPEGVARAIDALGLRSIQSMGVSSSYQDGACVTSSYTAAPAPARKGLLSSGNKILDLGFLKWVPKNAVSFSASTMDPLGLFDGLVGALKAYDPQFAEMALGQLGEMESKVGFTLRDDLFGAMGDSIITWSMPLGAITSPPEMAVVLKVNDQDRLVKVLKSLSAMTDGMVEIEEGEKRGIHVYQVRVNMDPTGGMGMNPFDMFSPNFSFKGGYMIAGFSASDVKRVFERMERANDPAADPKGDIRGNKEFEPYLGKLPKAVQSLSFSDWKAEFEGIYQMVTGVLAFVPISEEVPLDMSLLPDSNTITKHLFGAVSYSQADANGYASTSISPFGPEIVMVIAAAAGGIAAFVTAARF